MKSLLLAGVLATSLFAISAQARSFSGTYSESHNASSTGLEIGTADLTSAQSFSFSLDSGQSTTIDLYQIYANETTVNGDDTVPQMIDTVFNLPGGVGGGEIDGSTVGVKDTDAMGVPGYPGNHQFGQVTWDGPTSLAFADGSTLSISLNDAVFNEGEYYALNHGSYPYSGTAESNGRPIAATFTYKESVVPVSDAPEPGVWLLMLAGVGVLGATMRLKPAGRRGFQASRAPI